MSLRDFDVLADELGDIAALAMGGLSAKRDFDRVVENMRGLLEWADREVAALRADSLALADAVVVLKVYRFELRCEPTPNMDLIVRIGAIIDAAKPDPLAPKETP